ncbi:MAG TPA: hypothetical protein VFP54_10235 [Acidimicrobiales bacterium]|nr:hypothetical protein [Acidimicrobiales bacterium]
MAGTPSDAEREAFEAEMARRWSQDAPHPPVYAAVVEAAAGLDRECCLQLVVEYREAERRAKREGLLDDFLHAFDYVKPWPYHPGDLYAVDGWARIAAVHAGAVARDRGHALGVTDWVPVGWAATGACLAVEAAAAAATGAWCPFSAVADLLAAPWSTALAGDHGRPAVSPSPGP